MKDVELLAYDDAGAGPPLVLIHGLTFARQTWAPIVDALADRFRCLSIDLPGHGASTGSGAEPAVVVDRLRATLESAGVSRPVVIGHSAGALVAVGYAAQHAVAGVVDVDQPLLVGPFAALLQQREGALRGPDFATAFAPFEQSIGVHLLAEPERTRVAATRRVEQDLVLDHWALPLSTPPAEIQPLVDAMLDAIDAPFLYVSGEEVPPPVRDHLAAHLRRLELVALPGSGHLVHLAHPRRFAEAVADFATRRRRHA
ncbi:alpha/beta fold hydrolase [Nocardioides albidus]|uniref:alpha/beta fold hydrolase n=1 Tax=Nocardioides albidus TaxID=1517589 RepID=UPI0013051B4C|nr:alpha/beta hydrolase [Nocardioides albidus]